MIIQHNYSKNRINYLKSRGVDFNSFLSSREQIDLEDCLIKISTDIPHVITRTISVNRQLNSIEKLTEKPLQGNYVLGISSFPSDLKAKQLALHLINKAVDYQTSTKSKRLKSKAMPLWYRVYGNLGCMLRDKPDIETPSLLVIANITANSTNIKLEKVRDLLEKFSDIPRIVVMGGSDPLTFFATKFHYPIRYGIWLGPEIKNREI